MGRGHWEVGAAFRRLSADQWFVGPDVRESAAPFGQPLFLNIASLDATVTYGVTDRVSVTATIPFSRGTHNRFYADGQRHTVKAAGLGDVSGIANIWLWRPSAESSGNVAVGFGVKTASGNNGVIDNFFLAGGAVTKNPVDQSIQLGDGGVGTIFQLQAYHRLAGRASGYVYGWYLLTPREKTGISSPLAGVPLSVPDVYSFRSGISAALSRKHAISASLGPRLDGIPLRDFVGGSSGFRRPGYSLYLDPGVVWTAGRSTWSVNVPLRVHQNFQRSLADIDRGAAGGGDLARYLLLVGYSVRF
ncbi:MAG TPA: hypothetical protein VGF59_15160 [Bryobacteraceae bacterium]